MSKIYEKAAAELFSSRGWAEAEKALKQLEKNKRPTKDFHKVQDAVDLLKNILFDDDKVEVSYDGYHGTILIKTIGLSVPMYDMQIWRDLMNIVDGIAIEQRFDAICIELTCKEIFEV